jgi:hypothetical protein
MKSMFSLLFVLVGFSASAQFATSSALSPGAGNLSPVTPGFNNVFGSVFTTNAVPANLNTGLAALQNDIQQLLPVLANFNDTAALSALLSTLQASTTGGASVPVPLSGQNLSTRTSSDFSTLLSQNVSANVAGSTAVTTAGGSFSTAIGGPTQPALTPTGVSNPLGLAPGFGGPVTTNAFGTPVTARDVVRDLIVLQNDLERLLPVLVTLNGSSLPAGFTNMVGSTISAPSLGFNTALSATGR